MNKTPLEQLIEKLEKLQLENKKNKHQYHAFRAAIFIAKSLLPQERQMVVDAWNNGEENWMQEQNNEHFANGSDYFDQTFGKGRE